VPDPPKVVALRSDDVDAAAGVLARAFFDYPLWVWLVPGEERRRELLWLSALVNVRWGALMGETYVTSPLTALSIWTPPGARWGHVDPTGELTGWREFAQVAGDDVNRKFSVMSEIQHEARELAMGGRECWYLPWLGVDPPAQRTGAGSALLADMFKRTDAAAQPCILETEAAKNVPYYERHGFVVAHEGVVPDGGPPFWTLVREPR
jgi:GNAT superfamily N-acetyltransferase